MWPPLFLMASRDKSNTLMQMNGEYDALVVDAKDKKCAFANERHTS